MIFVCQVSLQRAGESVSRTNLVQHFVAFIENEDLNVAEAELRVANKGVQTARGANNNVRNRILVGEELDVFVDWRSAVEDTRFHVRHPFLEASVLIADLVSQLTGVAHDQDCRLSRNRVEKLKSCENEDCGFAKTRLGLNENICTQDGLGDGTLLDYKAPDELEMFAKSIRRWKRIRAIVRPSCEM